MFLNPNLGTLNHKTQLKTIVFKSRSRHDLKKIWKKSHKNVISNIYLLFQIVNRRL